MSYNPAYASELFDSMPELTDQMVNAVRYTYFQHYVFYENVTRNKRSGICSCCGHEFFARRLITNELAGDDFLWTAKYGAKTICPHCEAPVEFRPANIYHGMYSLTRYENVIFIFPDENSERKNGLFQRVYARAYSILFEPHPDRRADLVFVEKASYCFEPGAWYARWRSTQMYSKWYWNYLEVANGKYTGHLGDWLQCKSPREPWQKVYYNMPFYWTVGTSTLSETFLKYCCLDQYMEQRIVRRFPMRYLCRYVERPSAELLARTGCMDTLNKYVESGVKDIRLNWKAKDPLNFFGLSKHEWNVLRKNKIPLDQYVFDLKHLVRSDKELAQVVDFLVSNRGFAKSSNITYWASCLLRASHFTGYSFEKTRNYMERHKDQYYTYEDYVKMAQECGYDLTEHNVAFPKDLMQAHDTAMNVSNALKKERKEKLKALRLKSRKRFYEYTDGVYLIRLPRDGQEIVAEANALHHCVWRYVDRHMSGDTTILFMRSCKHPEKPLYTIEMRDADLQQVGGRGNREISIPAQRAFFDGWIRWLQNGGGAAQPQPKQIKAKTITA